MQFYGIVIHPKQAAKSHAFVILLEYMIEEFRQELFATEFEFRNGCRHE